MEHCFQQPKSGRALCKGGISLLVPLLALTSMLGACAPRDTSQNASTTPHHEEEPAAPPKDSPGTTEKHAAKKQPPESASAESVPPSPPGFSCGTATCFRFDEPAKALQSLVATKQPRILALGEAHAPQGYTGSSTVKRFTQELLPALAPQTSYLLVELLLPPAEGCQKERKQAQTESDKITEGQAATNQNEYAVLGKRARTLGVIPDILRASCDDLKYIASPEGGVFAMMETIAKISQKTLTTMLERAQSERPLVLAYGGALHNDAHPRKERETWSYGPALVDHTEGKYLEVDLMIPELIGDSESWRNFGWYDSYSALSAEEKNGALLMEWSEGSYVLFFAPQG